MSQITPDILAKIAPGTPHALRERFIPFMNEAMPRYDITTKNRVAAFLCTTCFESQYYQKTREGKARPDTAAGRAQAKYWSTGYFGRGILQTTHEEGYRLVGEYLKAKSVIDDSELFVDNPELLEEPKWAVESACIFWEQNHLNRYADSQNIFAVEGIVNRGNASKTAWGETDREKLWKILVRYLPNDFDLSQDSTATIQATAPTTADTSATARTDNTAPATEAPPSIAPIQTADTIVNTGDVATPTPAPQDVTLAAPAGMGSVQSATKMTVLGFAVPTSVYTIFAAIKSAMDNGFVDAKDIGGAVMNFISQNTKYVFILIGGVIFAIIVKKICRELIFLVTVISHAIPSWNSVTVVAPDTVPVTKKWYEVWK